MSTTFLSPLPRRAQGIRRLYSAGHRSRGGHGLTAALTGRTRGG
ncbi:hypothetical protein [Streptomyces albus]